MLQESTQAAAATGGNAAAALTQMGVDHLLGEMTSNPGAYAVSWAVLITLTIMSAMSIYWIVINFFKNASLRRSADRVVSTFWETPNAQDAIRYMEEQPRNEPFSKIALVLLRRRRAAVAGVLVVAAALPRLPVAIATSIVQHKVGPGA